LSHIYCPECGFQNPESAHYCSRCGALLVTDGEPDETTMTFSAEELHDERADLLDGLGIDGPAFVIRAGGGRTGEAFALDRAQTTIGRSPDCDIFLDDVTVSRRHAVVVRGEERFAIEDSGSLNGTFLNRSRIERGDLENGDEVQIGKYRLIFLAR
jgi:pSer/pThr/pTyr-binding forkhead associated (FHA) protein